MGEPRNTVGRGVAREPRSLVGQPAAQIEELSRPIGASGNTPVGFGALHRHWQPRASFAGTYDQAWMDTKMPLLPDDFDPRFHVTAPPDQWSELPLRSDEVVEVKGATPEGKTAKVGPSGKRFNLDREPSPAAVLVPQALTSWKLSTGSRASSGLVSRP